MTKQQHVQAAIDLAKMSEVWAEAWSEMVNLAILQHGDGNGVLISGVYREHFPAHLKDALRVMARTKTDCLDNSVRHWTAARRRLVTWRRMYAEVQEGR